MLLGATVMRQIDGRSYFSRPKCSIQCPCFRFIKMYMWVNITACLEKMLKSIWGSKFIRKISSGSHAVISKTDDSRSPWLSYKKNKIFIPTIYTNLQQIPPFHEQCPVLNLIALESHCSALFSLNLNSRQGDRGFFPSTQCGLPIAH